jgi:excisionase family DNA binding protein
LDAEDEHSKYIGPFVHHDLGDFRELLTVPEAAEYLRVSKNYLDKLRVSGGGPPFVRFGRRKVLYRLEDLKKWVEQRLHNSTSEYEE